MTLDSSSSLAIAEIVTYIPILLLSLPLVWTHAIRGHEKCWFYLPLLAILRLVSASTTLYIHTRDDYSSGLLETALITAAIGTAPLLLVLLAFVQRVNDAVSDVRRSRQVPVRVFRALHVISVVALILGIVGGSLTGEQDHNDTARACREASALLFIAVFVVQAACAMFLASARGALPGTEGRLALFAVAVLPFIAVRLIYSAATAFAHQGSKFYVLDENVYIEAFMQFLMEVIAIVIYILAGYLTPPATAHMPVPQADAELGDRYHKRGGSRGMSVELPDRH